LARGTATEEENRALTEYIEEREKEFFSAVSLAGAQTMDHTAVVEALLQYLRLPGQASTCTELRTHLYPFRLSFTNTESPSEETCRQETFENARTCRRWVSSPAELLAAIGSLFEELHKRFTTRQLDLAQTIGCSTLILQELVEICTLAQPKLGRVACSISNKVIPFLSAMAKHIQNRVRTVDSNSLAELLTTIDQQMTDAVFLKEFLESRVRVLDTRRTAIQNLLEDLHLELASLGKGHPNPPVFGQIDTRIKHIFSQTR
jgi:hypothetical protein